MGLLSPHSAVGRLVYSLQSVIGLIIACYSDHKQEESWRNTEERVEIRKMSFKHGLDLYLIMKPYDEILSPLSVRVLMNKSRLIISQ